MKGLRSPFPLVLAVLGCLGRISLVDGHGLTRRTVDNPGPDGFIRHRYPSGQLRWNFLREKKSLV